MPDGAAFAEHWGRAPLLTRAADLPGGFCDLLHPDDVDVLVAERGLRTPFFSLVRDGKPATGATRRVRAGNRELSDVADPEKVRELWADGATLVLNALHRTHPPIARFCRQLAADLGHAVQCNAYVTPGGDARGFAFHHDTHDVLVLQVDGRKRWVVHEPVLRLPLPGQSRAGDDLVPEGAEPLLDTVLEAGDVLYLPRGYVHAAETTEHRSLHLTVGLLATTWHDVLRDLLAVARDEESFRGSLPLRPGDGALEAGLPAFLRQVAAWAESLPPARLAEAVAPRLRRAVPLEPLGVLAQAQAVAALGPDTGLRPRVGLAWSVEPGEPGRAVLRLPDREVAVPAEVGPAVERALSIPVTPRSLAAEGVGVDLDDALVLLRRLLREGAVAPA